MKAKYAGNIYKLKAIKGDFFILEMGTAVISVEAKDCELLGENQVSRRTFQCGNCHITKHDSYIPMGWQVQPNDTWICPRCNGR